MRTPVSIPRPRNLLIILAVMGLAALVPLGYVEAMWDRPHPVARLDLAASQDASIIARGQYLAYGPAHCVHCHRPNAVDEATAIRDRLPLSGGRRFDIPPGSFFAPNITPDTSFGVGRYSDEQLAEFIRYGIHADGRLAIPFMEYQGVSDVDLVALISFLRSQAPVAEPVPPHQINLLGKAALALLLKAPAAEAQVPPPMPEPISRGAYLATAVGQCAECHTRRNLATGAFTGPRFAGGQELPHPDDPASTFVTPNLTPDARTGVITTWSEADFIARFRRGAVIPGTHMPWAAFSQMTEQDLKDLYAFLKTLPPVYSDNGPVLRARH